MATTDVNDAYRNVRIDPSQVHNFCYSAGDLVVIDFRLTFGWTGSPGNFGVMASAAEHPNCNTDLSNLQLLPEGVKMMEHVEIVDCWEVGDPTPVPPGAKKTCEQGGKAVEPSPHGGIYRRPRPHKSPSIGRGKTSFSHIGLARIGLRTTFWARRAGEDTHPSAKKELELEHNLRVLRFRCQLTHARISVTIKKAQAIQTALVDDWPRCRRQATAQEVFSIAGKLWNLTYVIRAGKYFVWRLLKITDLHTQTGKKTSRSVELGREFHDDLDFGGRQ